jgi:hypothetical protein
VSRSRKKRPFAGITTAESEAIGKRIWHRRYRHAANMAVSSGADVPDERQHSDVWLLAKDGKQYLPDEWRDKGMRK